jgi:hypothetical protein
MNVSFKNFAICLIWIEVTKKVVRGEGLFPSFSYQITTFYKHVCLGSVFHSPVQLYTCFRNEACESTVTSVTRVWNPGLFEDLWFRSSWCFISFHRLALCDGPQFAFTHLFPSLHSKVIMAVDETTSAKAPVTDSIHPAGRWVCQQ